MAAPCGKLLRKCECKVQEASRLPSKLLWLRGKSKALRLAAAEKALQASSKANMASSGTGASGRGHHDVWFGSLRRLL